MELAQVVEEYLLHKYRENKKVRGPNTAFYDSAAGSCLRQRVLRRANKDEVEPDGKGLLVMEIGNRLHDMYREALLWKGAVAIIEGEPMAEFRVVDEFSRGKIDFLLPVKGGYEIKDLKTVNTRAYDMVRREKVPKHDHRLQVGRYWLKLKAKFPILALGISYLKKDWGDGMEMPIEMTPELEKEVMDDKLQEQTAWTAYEADGTLPPIIQLFNESGEKTKDAWRCTYCSLAHHCGREAVSKYYEKSTSKTQEVKHGN